MWLSIPFEQELDCNTLLVSGSAPWLTNVTGIPPAVTDCSASSLSWAPAPGPQNIRGSQDTFVTLVAATWPRKDPRLTAGPDADVKGEATGHSMSNTACAKLQRYTSSDDVDSFLAYFDVIAKANEWTKEIQLLQLPAALDGSAFWMALDGRKCISSANCLLGWVILSIS